MLKAATAKIDITPADGSLMACFPRRTDTGRQPRHARGAHDRLCARVLVLDDGRQPVVLCSCDCCGWRDIDIDRIRRQLAERVPALGDEHCIIGATHTHSSPETLYMFGNTPRDPWVRQTIERIAKAIADAYERRRPAGITLGMTDAPLNFNRRSTDPRNRGQTVHEYAPGATDEVTDPLLAVLSVRDADRRVLAVLANYTAHALTVGPHNDLYTADYPGVLCRQIESRIPEAAALFFNGAAGNIHPLQCMRRDFRVMEAFGTRLAEYALPLVESGTPLEVNRFTFATRTLSFVNRMDASIQTSVELSCLRIGDALLLTVPAELFVEYQLRLRDALAPARVIVFGYTNGWAGYIPTLQAYEIGGYGVTAADDPDPAYSRTALPQHAGDEIYAALLDMGKACLGTDFRTG